MTHTLGAEEAAQPDIIYRTSSTGGTLTQRVCPRPATHRAQKYLFYKQSEYLCEFWLILTTEKDCLRVKNWFKVALRIGLRTGFVLNASSRDLGKVDQSPK